MLAAGAEQGRPAARAGGRAAAGVASRQLRRRGGHPDLCHAGKAALLARLLTHLGTRLPLLISQACHVAVSSSHLLMPATAQGRGIDDVKEWAVSQLPLGPRLYPKVSSMPCHAS